MKNKNYLFKLISILLSIAISLISMNFFCESVISESVNVANRLINPSFENTSNDWETGWGWSISNEEANTGSYSLKCVGSGGWGNTNQTVQVVQNSQYTLSFYAKTSVPAVYKVMGGSTNLTGDLWTGSTSSWAQYSVSFNSGNSSSVILYVADAGGGTLYFDDFVLNGPSTNFIERDLDKLELNGVEFRFVGANSYYLHDNSYTDDYTTQYVIDDVFKTCNEMGITVVRFFPNWTGSERSLEPTLGVFNEISFEHLDYIIKAASDYGIKLIIPLSNYYTTLDTFTSWRGVDREQFNTNPTVINDFKDLIYNILNRTNTYTNIAYKDDPVILCWETGNELRPPYSWTSEIAAYIKSVDLEHLVMDGNYGVDNDSLYDDNIDIVSSHFYFNEDYVPVLNSFRNGTRNIKPFIAGEFGDNSANRNTQYSNLLSEAVADGVSGLCFWSLFGHRDNGGFQYHSDSYSLHYPGDDSYMETTMDILRNGAYAMRGLSVPAKSIPVSPIIVKSISAPNGIYIQYKGSVGAKTYVLERSTNASGPWSIMSSSEKETKDDYIGYLDTSAAIGIPYYYRMKAVNLSGSSGYTENFISTRVSKSNMVLNPGFESGTTGWTLSWNWGLSSAYKNSGSTSLLLNGSTSWSSAYQTINVLQNTNYVLSFYGKSTAPTLFKIMNSAFSTDISLTRFTNSTNQWKRYEISFYTGNNTSINILLSDGGGTHYFDDFNLFQLPPVTFSRYVVSGSGSTKITNIQPDLTVGDFLNPDKAIVERGTDLIFKNRNGAVIGLQDKITTGTEIEVYVSNVKVNTYATVIYGDINNDGLVSIEDMVLIKHHLLKIATIEDVEFIAADIIRNGSVSIIDLISIKKHLVGIKTINQYQSV